MPGKAARGCPPAPPPAGVEHVHVCAGRFAETASLPPEFAPSPSPRGASAIHPATTLPRTSSQWLRLSRSATSTPSSALTAAAAATKLHRVASCTTELSPAGGAAGQLQHPPSGPAAPKRRTSSTCVSPGLSSTPPNRRAVIYMASSKGERGLERSTVVGDWGQFGALRVWCRRAASGGRVLRGEELGWGSSSAVHLELAQGAGHSHGGRGSQACRATAQSSCTRGV